MQKGGGLLSCELVVGPSAGGRVVRADLIVWILLWKNERNLLQRSLIGSMIDAVRD